MALDDAHTLRMLLGEDIQDGGKAEDTLFSEAEIEHFLEGAPSVERAAYEGWRAKAARLATLVDTTEGNAQRKYSQLYANAQEMVKHYSKTGTGPTEGRARVGSIKRSPVQW